MCKVEAEDLVMHDIDDPHARDLKKIDTILTDIRTRLGEPVILSWDGGLVSLSLPTVDPVGDWRFSSPRGATCSGLSAKTAAKRKSSGLFGTPPVKARASFT